jgi:hypothetical protein
MKQLTMETILTTWTEANPPISLEISRSDNTTLYASELVYYEFWRYWTYSLIAPPSRTTALWALQEWMNFCALYAGDLERAYDALYADYDPISNYDMTENGSDGTMRDDVTDTVTPSGKTTATAETLGKLKQESKNYVGGYDSTGDSGAFSDRTVTTTEPDVGGYKVQTETTYTDAKTESVKSHDNSMTTTMLPGAGYNDLTDHHLSRRGNIGVTTSQQMIMSEVELRKQELLSSFVHRFVHRHFAILGGGHCDD